jgi:hypothetical protein
MKKKTEEVDLIKKQNKKLKVICLLLSIIVLLGVAGAGTLGYLFFHKDVAKKSKVIQEIVRIRKKIHQSQKDYGKEYFENHHNASYKIDLYDGKEDMHATHPKVLNFEKKWNGYKYWMVYSPYPYMNDEYENPWLVVSNDKIHWKTPKGLTNPIEQKPNNYEHGKVYNSDPHILYNKDTDKMELYFRYVDDINDRVIIYRRTSSDGVKWLDKEEIITHKRSKIDFMSPAVIYDNGVYKMWFVNRNKTPYYIESKDGYNYSDPIKIDLNYPIPGIRTWHLDAIKTENGYELLVSAYRNHKDRNSMNLYHFVSKDGINFKKGTIVLRPSISSWDNKGLYRSTFMYEDGVYYVYYSGISMGNERGIGLSFGSDINNLIGSTIKKDNN